MINWLQDLRHAFGKRRVKRALRNDGRPLLSCQMLAKSPALVNSRARHR